MKKFRITVTIENIDSDQNQPVIGEIDVSDGNTPQKFDLRKGERMSRELYTETNPYVVFPRSVRVTAM